MFKTDLAYENWQGKYRYGDETPLETQKRVAKSLASVEKSSEQKKWEEKFLKTLVRFNEVGDPVGLKCTMGGRVTANIGTSFKGATLLNCFINGPVSNATLKYNRRTDDGSIIYPVSIKSSDNPDDLINIFLTVMEQSKTLASEGGYGINFDWIRPRGAIIRGTGIEHPGVVSYMKIWDSVADCIVKGNNDGYIDKIRNYLKDENAFKEGVEIVKAATRKGAMMGCLSVWHPDIEEFIRAKEVSRESKVLTKFNLSVVVDDKFMQAVADDDFYDLKFNNKIYKRVKARELYDLVMDHTYNNNEPGIIFVDNMTSNNPLSYLGRVNSTNPCGEVPGIPSLTTVCLLGSLNLTQYVRVKDFQVGFDNVSQAVEFDWDEYQKDIKIFTRMLDNVNDLTYSSLPSYDWATKNIRQFGMGINGLGSALMMLGIPYNSKEALDFVKKATEIKENLTWQASAELAAEKGPFNCYDAEKFQSTEYFKSKRLWPETKDLIKKQGIRNGKTTTNPPLGNSSIICDIVSNGIEPVFLLEYERKKIVSSWPEGLTIDNIKQILKRKIEYGTEFWEGDYQGKSYYYEPHNRGLCEVCNVRDYGYNWLKENFPEIDHSAYTTTTAQLKISDHLNIQEIVQFNNNQSVSKTCNLPAEYPFDEFKGLYFDAWKRGLNGFTTYRAGTMESVLSDFSKPQHDGGIIEKDIKLPDTFVNGPTRIIKREGIKFYIHFSYLPEDTEQQYPVVIWIYTNNKEKNVSSVCNKASRRLAKLALEKGVSKEIVEETLQKARVDYPHNRLGRVISLNLRHNVDRVDILTSLMDIEGDNISTLLTAVRKFLAESIEDGTSLKSMKCPSCGSVGNMVLQSGCSTCLDCGFSGCG